MAGYIIGYRYINLNCKLCVKIQVESQYILAQK